MQPAVPAIEILGLTKAYKHGAPPALDQLTLAVNHGEIFGYLGPNGAGKTTTIRLLLDLIRPDKGSATIFGHDTRRDSIELHHRIGFLPGELNLWDSQTGNNVLRYLNRIRGGSALSYARQLAERLQLDLSKTVRSYSSGNRRKLGLVIALMHKPDLLILDEPTNGLDPLMQQIFYQLMREARNEGRTVFLSSHILSEVQAICDRVGILRDGKLKAVERVTDLTQVKFQWVTVRFKEPVDSAPWGVVPGISELSSSGNEVKFRLTGDFDPVLRKLNSHYIVGIRTEEPSLEEIFLTFYGPDGKRSTGQHQAVKEAAK